MSPATILENRVLIACCLSWLVAQLLKFLISWAIEKKMDWHRCFGMGGMPSSHSAFVFSLALATGLQEGFNTTMFAITFALILVVIYDAMGVRYETGRQGKVINQILRELFMEGKPLTDEKLKELVGHSPLEVLGGVLVGLMMTLIIFA